MVMEMIEFSKTVRLMDIYYSKHYKDYKKGTNLFTKENL